MTLDSGTKTIHENVSQEYGQRFVCISDFSDYSVELVIQCGEKGEKGCLTVWDDRDIIVNCSDVDVDIEEPTMQEVGDFFEDFLLGEVNNYLR